MNGLTGLGRAFSPTMGNLGNYSRNNLSDVSFSPSPSRMQFSQNFKPFLQTEPDEDENLPDISERLNAINRENHSPFARRDKFQELLMEHNENALPFGRVNLQQNPMSLSDFMPVNESNSGSFSNNNVSFNASIFGNDALQFITTLQGIISSPAEYKRHKENGTLPTDRDLKNLEENMLGQLKKLTAEKTNITPQSDNMFGGLKDMFQQNMERKSNDIHKLIGGDKINTSSQDVSGLQEALKNISGV